MFAFNSDNKIVNYLPLNLILPINNTFFLFYNYLVKTYSIKKFYYLITYYKHQNLVLLHSLNNKLDYIFLIILFYEKQL